MKRVFVLFLLTVVMIGCTPQENPVINDDRDIENTPFAVAMSKNVARESAVPEALLNTQAESINRFAVNMYRQLIAEEDGNVFFSPYSITAALGMTEAGARNNTSVEIRDALSVTLQGDEFHAALGGLDLAFSQHQEQTSGLSLSIVNSTWAQSGWELRIPYLNSLARFYGAGVNLLDFMREPEPSRVVINTWVADQTNDRIEDLIPEGIITSDTRLVLTNAIYFLADWFYSFDKSLTKDEDFRKIDNTIVTIPLMQLGSGEPGERVKLNYSRVGDVRAIDFPYKGERLCMTVLLPDHGSFNDFEQQLEKEAIDELLAAINEENLPPVRFPRFSFTSGSISIKDALINLGMIDAFSSDADFTGIDAVGGLFVQDVVHKAFISVDEEGTEAAAATAVIIDRTSVPDDPVEFIADRPFIYLIRDRVTGTILFMGRVLDPSVDS